MQRPKADIEIRKGKFTSVQVNLLREVVQTILSQVETINNCPAISPKGPLTSIKFQDDFCKRTEIKQSRDSSRLSENPETPHSHDESQAAEFKGKLASQDESRVGKLNGTLASQYESQVGERTGIIVQEKTKKPDMFAVIVHNDSFTPRQFVIDVLKLFFQKSEAEAARIMLTAHQSGHSVVSIYTREVAETKVAKANSYSHEQGKLLLFSVEVA